MTPKYARSKFSFTKRIDVPEKHFSLTSLGHDPQNYNLNQNYPRTKTFKFEGWWRQGCVK